MENDTIGSIAIKLSMLKPQFYLSRSRFKQTVSANQFKQTVRDTPNGGKLVTRNINSKPT